MHSRSTLKLQALTNISVYCYVSRSARANHEFQQVLKEAEFFHKPLRLNLARLKLQDTQESRKQMNASKLPQNPKIRITTILDQFWDKAAR